MSPAEVIAGATADGVQVVVTGPDELKALGRADAVRRWLPQLKEQKPALVRMLAEQDCGQSMGEFVPYSPDPNRAPTRPATESERAELAELIVALGEPIEYRAEARRLALLDPDAALECFRRIVKEAAR